MEMRTGLGAVYEVTRRLDCCSSGCEPGTCFVFHTRDGSFRCTRVIFDGEDYHAVHDLTPEDVMRLPSLSDSLRLRSYSPPNPLHHAYLRELSALAARLYRPRPALRLEA